MHIIFDLCGPLIQIDVERINSDLHNYGLPSTRGYHDLRDAGLIMQYDSGLIGPEHFASEARKVWGYNLPDELLWKAWNNVVYGFDIRHVDTVRQLKLMGHNTYVLSNSDEVNAKHFCNYMNKHAGFDFTGTCFTELMFSCQLHCRKPNPEIFHKVINRFQLRPSNTLFIDDSRKNCLAAQQAGIPTHYLADGEQIEDVTEIIELLQTPQCNIRNTK